MSRKRFYEEVEAKILMRWLEDPDELVRAGACSELGYRGHEAERGVPRMVFMSAHDEDALVRGAVVQALVQLARAAEYPEKAHLVWAIDRIEAAVEAQLD